MNNEYLLVERLGPLLTLTLNNIGNINSFHLDMIISLTFAIHNAQKDADVKVIILSDAGCSSTSFEVNTEFLGISQTGVGFGMLNECILAMKKSQKPIIASVHGIAADALVNLAFASDIIVAAEDSQFSLNNPNEGQASEQYGAYFQSRLIGPYLAKQLSCNGNSISGLRLHQLGAINYIAPLDKLKEETTKLAFRLADVSENAFGMIKKFIDRSLIHALEGILEQERLNNKLKYFAKDQQNGDLCL